jgi:VCBS repeat-containing protein
VANHRKISANRNKQAKRLAVLAFLGLAVASPGIATASADATEGSSASTDAGTKTDAGPKGDPDGDNDAGIGDAESEDGDADDDAEDLDDDADDVDEDDLDGGEDDLDEDAEEADDDEIDESEPPPVEGDDASPEPTQSSGAPTSKAALRNAKPEPVDAMSMNSTPTDLESSSITTEPDDTVAPQQTALVETLADPEVDEKSPWDFLPQYPEIAGVTNTEVAAVVFIAAAAATVISIPTAPLLTIPLLLVTIAAWTRFEDLGTNHHAPTAQVTNTIRALGVVTGTLIGNDEDGDPVNITLENGPANGNVQIIGSSLLGGFQYIYTANNPLTLGAIDDSFTIKIDDYGGWRNHPLGMHAVSMTIDVTSGSVINGFPVFTQEATIVSTDPDTQQMLGTFAATDPDGTPLTFTGFAVSSLLGTSVEVSYDEDGNGTFTYTPSDAAIQAARLDFLGIGDLITITATDANGGFAISTVTVHLVSPNTPPVVLPVGTAIPDLATGLVTGTVVGTDVDGDTLHYSVTGYGGALAAELSNGGMAVVDSSGKWIYIPPVDGGGFLGAVVDDFTIYVTDGRGGQASTIIGVLTHDLEIGRTANVSGTTVTGGLNIPPTLQGLFTYATGSGPTKGEVTVNVDGTYAYTSNVTGHGTSATDTFTIVGVDANGLQVTLASITVTPELPNTAPSASYVVTGHNSTNLGALSVGTASGAITVTDADGDTDFTYVVSGSSVLAPNIGTSTKGGVVTVNGDGTFDYASPLGLPHSAAPGGTTDTFSVTVADGFGGTTQLTVTVPIDPVNNNPTHVNTTGASGRDAFLNTGAWVTTVADLDLDSVTATVTPTTKGTVSVSKTAEFIFTVTYTSTSSRTGFPPKHQSETFTITYSDGLGGSVTRSYTF